MNPVTAITANNIPPTAIYFQHTTLRVSLCMCEFEAYACTTEHKCLVIELTEVSDTVCTLPVNNTAAYTALFLLTPLCYHRSSSATLVATLLVVELLCSVADT
jgi:hypothetical protein